MRRALVIAAVALVSALCMAVPAGASVSAALPPSLHNYAVKADRLCKQSNRQVAALGKAPTRGSAALRSYYGGWVGIHGPLVQALSALDRPSTRASAAKRAIDLQFQKVNYAINMVAKLTVGGTSSTKLFAEYRRLVTPVQRRLHAAWHSLGVDSCA